MKRRSVVALVAAAGPGLATRGLADERPKTTSLISLVQVLSRPEALDGFVVLTAGYVVVDGDNSAVYLHREDYEECVLPNSVAISISQAENEKWKSARCSYVALKATFQASEATAVRRGRFVNVVTIDAVPGRKGTT
jgi:hypothetical protein